MASVYDPTFSNLAYESKFINEFANISSARVSAYYSDKGNNLQLGATSNLLLQAVQGIEMYTNTSNSFRIYTCDSYGQDIKEIMKISYSNNSTVFSACNFDFTLTGAATIGNAYLGDSNNYQLFSTENPMGFSLNNNVAISSNLTVYDNLACGGNIFGSTLNLYTYSPNTIKNSNLTRVGYSFHINPYNQLELLRTDQNTLSNIVSNKVTRVMTFGNTEFNNQDKDNPENYMIMKQFDGILNTYPTNGPINYRYIRWSVNGNNVFYNDGNVGLGTSSPESKLHVVGNIQIGSNIITSNLDFWNANGNRMSLWNTYGSNLICYSNIGLFKNDPQYTLDINGSLNAIGYCNILLDSYNSKSIHHAPTCSNFSHLCEQTTDAVLTASYSSNMSTANYMSIHNILQKTTKSNITISSDPRILMSMNSEFTGHFYTLYVGPVGPNYAKAHLLWNNIDQESIVVPLLANNITVEASGSNIMVSAISEYEYPWSLHEM